MFGLATMFAALRAWLSANRPTKKDIIKTFLTFCVMGMVPGAWAVGAPTLFIYGIYEYERIARWLLHRVRQLADYRRNGGRYFAEWAAAQFLDHPVKWAKAALAAFILFTAMMPFGLLAIYGLYRTNEQEWAQRLHRGYEIVYDFFSRGLNYAARRGQFYHKLAFAVGAAILAAYTISMYGMAWMIAEAVFVSQLIMATIGAQLLLKDVKTAFRNPIATFSNHGGKILGAIIGRNIANQLFLGHITGSLGPASGHVESNGIMSALFGSTLNPSPGFNFQTGDHLANWRFIRYGYYLLTCVFFSQNMSLWGDFQGYVGPTSFQLLLCSALGGLVGYSIERMVDDFYNYNAELFTHRLPPLANAANRGLRQVVTVGYAARWHAGFIAAATPVILLSGAGASVLAAVGGSMAAAAAVTAGGLVASMGAAYGLIYGAIAFDRVMLRAHAQMQPNPVPRPPVVANLLNMLQQGQAAQPGAAGAPQPLPAPVLHMAPNVQPPQAQPALQQQPPVQPGAAALRFAG